MMLEAPSRYSQSAFRILGLPMTASGSEIQLRADEICVRGKLGKICQYEYDFPWMGPLDRSEETVRDAAQRLSDPLRRMHEELGWFWGWSQTDQEALARLSKNDRAGAQRIWKSQQESDGEASIIAMFNQAILAHSSVIGEEILLQDGIGPLIQFESDETHWKNWRFALQSWADLAKEERFWILFKCMVRSRDDARLTESTKDELRESLLPEILQPSLVLLEQAMRDRSLGLIRRHAQVLNQSQLPPKLFRPHFEKILEPHAVEIRQACENVTRSLNQKIVPGLASSEVSKIGLEIYGTLMQHTISALELGKILDPESRTSFVVERDSYGDALRQIATRLANEGRAHLDKNLLTSALRLLEESIRSSSASAHIRLKADKTILEEWIRDLGSSQEEQGGGDKAEAQPKGDAKTRSESTAVQQTVIDVKLNSKGQYSYRRICSCCLIPTDDMGSISGSRTENQVFQRVNHTLKLSLPICKECKTHVAWENKRKTLWWSAIIVSVVLALWIGSAIPGANWVVMSALFFLGDGIAALCLNKWVPRREFTAPHVSRGMPAHIHSLEEGSFVIRFSNERFGRTFSQANRPIVLGEDAIRISRGFISKLGIWNEKHGRLTAVAAGVLLIIGLASIPPGYRESVRTQSPPIRLSTVEKNALEQEKAELTRMHTELEADTNRLQNIRQRIDVLAARINQIDNSGFISYELQAERERLVVEHNALVDNLNALRTDALQRANDFEARRLAFNTRVEEYNRRFGRR